MTGRAVRPWRYWTVAAGVAAAVLGAFAVVEALGVPLLVDPRPAMDGHGAAVAAVGVALLVVDVVVPVPSSVVMVTLGLQLGAVAGSVAAVVGSSLAGLAGFALGRTCGPRLLARVPEDERERVGRALARWGPAALLLTRPVPVLAETAAIMAGASSLPRRSTVAALVVGSVPAAVVYAVGGSLGAEAGGAVLVLAGAVVLTGMWVVLRRQRLSRVAPTG